MICGNCARENRPDSRFCAGCGNALSTRCAACDRELQPDAAFCDGCGTPVAGSPPPAPTPAPAESVAVRKTVTALFCDLVGSTAFGERVDAEAARAAMGRYHSLARSVIESHGGTVAKFIGDGVMAMWGVPEVAEDGRSARTHVRRHPVLPRRSRGGSSKILGSEGTPEILLQSEPAQSASESRTARGGARGPAHCGSSPPVVP